MLSGKGCNVEIISFNRKMRSKQNRFGFTKKTRWIPMFLRFQVLKVWKQWPLEDRVPAEHLVSRRMKTSAFCIVCCGTMGQNSVERRKVLQQHAASTKWGPNFLLLVFVVSSYRRVTIFLLCFFTFENQQSLAFQNLDGGFSMVHFP